MIMGRAWTCPKCGKTHKSCVGPMCSSCKREWEKEDLEEQKRHHFEHRTQRRVIPHDDFRRTLSDGTKVNNLREHNWLWAEEQHEITFEEWEAVKNGDCLALNVNDEFVVFVTLKGW